MVCWEAFPDFSGFNQAVFIQLVLACVKISMFYFDNQVCQLCFYAIAKKFTSAKKQRICWRFPEVFPPLFYAQRNLKIKTCFISLFCNNKIAHH